jgi:hypothetical protein
MVSIRPAGTMTGFETAAFILESADDDSVFSSGAVEVSEGLLLQAAANKQRKIANVRLVNRDRMGSLLRPLYQLFGHLPR